MRTNKLKDRLPGAFRKKLLKMFSKQLVKDYDVVSDYIIIFGTDKFNEIRKKEDWFEIIEEIMKVPAIKDTIANFETEMHNLLEELEDD